MRFDPGQLRALDAAVAEGTLEAAARLLHVTPSAVSQRIRALEVATGRILLVRSKPVRPTGSGRVLLRLARQVELLGAEAARELGGDGEPGGRPVVPLAVNADSLDCWVLPALAPLAAEVDLRVHREDEDRTCALLGEGSVMAAVTTQARAVPGCRVTRLGTMRYRPMAAPAFVRRWFPDGATPRALAASPVVVFDRHDELQHRWLRRRAGRPLDPPLHLVPSSQGFLDAVRLGMGWGMLPDLHSAPAERDGEVVALDAGGTDVVLHWQQWRLRSASLDRVAAAVLTAARAALLP